MKTQKSMGEEKRKLFLTVTIVTLLTISAANAALINIAISGSVSEIHDPCGHLDGFISVGNSVSGNYVYNTDAIPDTGGPAPGYWYTYTELPSGMSVDINGITFKTDPDNIGFVINVVDSNNYDAIRARSVYNISSEEGVSVGWMEWQLFDEDAQALSNMDLPTTAPDLNDWSYTGLLISEDFTFFPGDNYIITCEITSAVLVPEPVSILLLGLGALIFRRKVT